MREAEQYHAFLRARTSCRHFLPDPVAEVVLNRMIETATRAASAHNRQPWRFAVLRTAMAKDRLADAMAAAFRRDLEVDGVAPNEQAALLERSRSRIMSAPLAIAVCMDMTDMDVYPDVLRQRAERTMATQSVANAATTLLLAAEAEGLGAVWICGPLFAPQEVREALELAVPWEPQALLLVGKPARAPAFRPRRELNEVVVYR